eukprot:363335-Chlamydomonas_euryale.AAC.8
MTCSSWRGNAVHMSCTGRVPGLTCGSQMGAAAAMRAMRARAVMRVQGAATQRALRRAGMW